MLTSKRSALPSDAEGWNLTRFDPATLNPKRGHLESTFVKLNDPTSTKALWLKLTVFSPTSGACGEDPRKGAHIVGEAWAIAFDRGDGTSARTRDHLAVKRSVPIATTTLARTRPYRIEIAGVHYDGKRVHGEIARSVGERIAFDLTLTPREVAPYVPFPHPGLYFSAFPKTKLVSPILDASADGVVDVTRRGVTERWIVEGWSAMQGHNWGTAHADTYAWAHCNQWHEPEGEGLVLEGFSAKVKLAGGLRTPMVTIVSIRDRGVRYEATTLAQIPHARGSIEGLRRWNFRAVHADARIEGSLSMRDDDIVGLYYPNPNGEMTFCLNSKIARATLRFEAHRRAPRVLTSDAAALEIATHDPMHGAKMYV